MQISYLIFYAVTVCFITVRAFVKRRSPVYCALWSEYAVSAVFCVLCVMFRRTMVGSGQMLQVWYDLSDTTLMGYILLIVCTLIAFEPFKNFDRGNQLDVFGKRQETRNFFTIYTILYLAAAAVFILLSVRNIISIMNISDYGDLRMSMSNSENEMAVQVTSNPVANICYKMCFQFKGLSVFIAFGSLKERTNRVMSVILLAVTFFIVYITNASVAGRGSFMIFAFSTIIIGMTFLRYLPKAARVKVIVGAAILVTLVISYFIAVSVSRIATLSSRQRSNALLNNIAFYLGHGPIEFSKITGSLTDFAYGQTIFGRMISHYTGAPYSWSDIAHNIGYPPIGAVYNTYLGYLYTDFGAVGCLLFTSAWSYFVYHIMKKRPFHISTIFVFTYYLHYYATGNFVTGRLEYVRVVTTVLIYLLIRLIERMPNVRRWFTMKIRVDAKGIRRKKQPVTIGENPAAAEES